MKRRGLNLVAALALFNGLFPALSTGQELFVYPPISTPLLDPDPSFARPLAVGPVAFGLTIANVTITTMPFSAPMDFYLGIYAPRALGTDAFLLVTPNDSIQFLTEGLVPWRSGVTSVNESLFGDFPSGILPAGMYNLFLMATPAGNPASFTLWQTWFGVGQVVQVLGTTMSGGQAVPNPVTTPATAAGDITVVRDTNEIASTQTFSDLTTGIVDAHIHIGAAGTNGPVILGFQGTPGVISGTWSAPLGATLLPSQIDALLENGLYYQIHTPTNPGGELRGQINVP